MNSLLLLYTFHNTSFVCASNHTAGKTIVHFTADVSLETLKAWLGDRERKEKDWFFWKTALLTFCQYQKENHRLMLFWAVRWICNYFWRKDEFAANFWRKCTVGLLHFKCRVTITHLDFKVFINVLFFKCNTPDNIDQIFSVLCYISHTKQTKITIILKYKIYETMWRTFLNESVLHTVKIGSRSNKYKSIQWIFWHFPRWKYL